MRPHEIWPYVAFVELINLNDNLIDDIPVTLFVMT